MNFIKGFLVFWFSQKENITFVIAVLGFELSLCQLLSSSISKRECYKVDIVDYKKPCSDIVQFLLVVHNRSTTPLVISEIFFEGVPFELERKKIRERPGWGDFGLRHTPDFPLCVDAQGCCYFYLEFVDISRSAYQHTELSPGTVVNLKIHSTRKSVWKTVTLGDISHYLHTTEQHQIWVEKHQNGQ